MVVLKSKYFWVLLALVGMMIPGLAYWANFPSKPITLIVPYPAGGATDVVIRPLAEAAKKYLGQPVIVENRGGGGGAVGLASLSENPDGYLLVGGGHQSPPGLLYQ